MKIKVLCPCGSKFEFEAEPVNGRMPVAIACPTCGADATALANEVIERQLPAAPPVGSLRISKAHAATPAAPATAVPAAAAFPDETAAEPCPKHPTELSVEHCRVCGKPICLKCMEQFGYVCSAYCRQQAVHRKIDVPVYAHQKSVVAGKSHALAKRLAYAITLLVVVVLGLWFWYAWFARNYKIVYSIQFPKPDLNSTKYVPEPYYRLIGLGLFATFDDKQLSLYDVKQKKQLWSATLPVNKPASNQDEAFLKRIAHRIIKLNHASENDLEHFDFDSINGKIIVTASDIWFLDANRLARFDRATGAPRDLAVKGQITDVSGDDSAILAVTENADGSESINRIALPGGDVESETLKAAPPKEAPATKLAAAKNKSAKPDGSIDKIPVGGIKKLATQSNQAAAPAEDFASDFSDDNQPFIIDGSTVVQFQVKELEHKTTSHVAMKAKGKSVLESDNLNASQGLDVAQEMMNDSRREATGGVEIEDVSRNQVTLHRHFASGVADWTGEVIGPPRFYALKTVDVLCAGQSIYVFDKNNKKLWDTKLTFSVANRFNGDPCLETADALYFADLGMLTRFDLQTGNVRWRYNTVGISKIQADAKGAIYINTTTAGPESIQYSQQIDIHAKIHPVIQKIDPAAGKSLWSLTSVGDTCYFSGKFLYSTLTSTSMAALHLEDGPDRHFYLNLLDPRTGRDIWALHRGNEHIIKTEVQDNWILLQFREEMLVLNFFSL